MIVVEGTILLVKSLMWYPKKSCRGWGKIRVALLRCDNQRLADSYEPQKEGWYDPVDRGTLVSKMKN